MSEKDELEFNDDEENVFFNEENAAPKDDEEKHYIIPHTVVLEQPFEYGKKTYTEFVFQNELELGMWAHIPAGEGQKIGHMIPMISGMTGQTREVVKKLRPADAKVCMEIANYFLSLGVGDAKTGDTTPE